MRREPFEIFLSSRVNWNLRDFHLNEERRESEQARANSDVLGFNCIAKE